MYILTHTQNRQEEVNTNTQGLLKEKYGRMDDWKDVGEKK